MFVDNFKPFPGEEDYRTEQAHSKGGIQCIDKEMTSKLRSVGKEVIA